MENLLGPFGAGDWKTRKLAAIEQDCAIQPNSVFVAESHACIVGYVTTRLNPTTGVGWIPNLAVASENQGSGIGRALLEFAIEYLRASGMEVAKIETLEQNPIGQKLYPDLGFVEVARQVHFAMRLSTANGEIVE